MRPKLHGLGSVRLGIFRKYLSMTVNIFKPLVLRTSEFEEATDSMQIFTKHIWHIFSLEVQIWFLILQLRDHCF